MIIIFTISDSGLSTGRLSARGPLDWRRFSNARINDCFLDGDFFTESLERILSLELFKFNWSVLVQEFVNGEVPSTNSDLDCIFFDLDGNSLGSELVNTFRFSHEHNLQFGSLRIIVNEFGQLLIDGILLNWDIDSDSLFQIDDILFQCLDFNFGVLKLFQKLQRRLISLVNFFLKLENVIGRMIQLFL